MRRNTVTLAFAVACIGWGVSEAGAQCVLPYNLANGQPADATQVMANYNALLDCVNDAEPAGADNAIQYKSGAGALGGVGPLDDGELVIGSTGNPPAAANLTAGAGIAITNGPGSVTISSSDNAYVREFGPFAPPTAGSFTVIDNPSSITPSVTDVTNVGLVYSAPITTNITSLPGAYRAVPATASWTLTVRAKYATFPGQYPEFGIYIKDSSGKLLGTTVQSRSSEASLMAKRYNSSTSASGVVYQQTVSDAPTWFRVNYDGTNINFYVSWDSQNWLFFYTETKTTFLNGTLELVGIGGLTGITSTSLWRSGSTLGAVVTYWDIDDDPASGRTLP